MQSGTIYPPFFAVAFGLSGSCIESPRLSSCRHLSLEAADCPFCSEVTRSPAHASRHPRSWAALVLNPPLLVSSCFRELMSRLLWFDRSGASTHAPCGHFPPHTASSLQGVDADSFQAVYIYIYIYIQLAVGTHERARPQLPEFLSQSPRNSKQMMNNCRFYPPHRIVSLTLWVLSARQKVLSSDPPARQRLVPSLLRHLSARTERAAGFLSIPIPLFAVQPNFTQATKLVVIEAWCHLPAHFHDSKTRQLQSFGNPIYPPPPAPPQAESSPEVQPRFGRQGWNSLQPPLQHEIFISFFAAPMPYLLRTEPTILSSMAEQNFGGPAASPAPFFLNAFWRERGSSLTSIADLENPHSEFSQRSRRFHTQFRERKKKGGRELQRASSDPEIRESEPDP